MLAKQYGIREHDMATLNAEFVPFTAQTRMSGVDLDGHQLRKGAGDSIINFVARAKAARPRRSCRRSSTGSAARAGRRLPSHATARCSA